MFVRIIHTNKDNMEYDSLYECTRVYRRPLKGLEGPIKDKVDFDLEGPGGNHVTIQIDKTEKVAVYIMNSDGKTIDSYRWDL